MPNQVVEVTLDMADSMRKLFVVVFPMLVGLLIVFRESFSLCFPLNHETIAKSNLIHLFGNYYRFIYIYSKYQMVCTANYTKNQEAT